MSDPNKIVARLLGSCNYCLLPVLLVILVEALVVVEERVSSLDWPTWLSLVLMAVNVLTYCLAGALATYRNSKRPLLSAIFAGMILVVVEAVVRSASVGLSHGSSESELFIKSIQETMSWTAGFSSIQLALLGVILQYMVFSPFYVGLSLLGGFMARRRLTD